MMQCQAEMISDTRRIPDVGTVTGKEQEAAVCGAMRNYVDCVKYPIRYECGYRAWYVVREVIVRPTKLLMPQCDIASSAAKLHTNSCLLILPVFSVIVVYFYSCRNRPTLI
uniref:Uncharacterized protein n=1 Tax=Plectus sambesii TaxID=2011161 RepID=A0A914ULV8_9BILA